MFKPDKVINYELMKRFSQERLPTERRSVQSFSLLMTYCFFDDLNAELRITVCHLILGILQVLKEPIDRLFQFRTSNLFPVSYTLCVL